MFPFTILHRSLSTRRRNESRRGCMWRGRGSTANGNSSTEAARGGGGVALLLRWAIYISLLLLRFIGIDQRGYVHPDEFYQGGQELFFGRGRSDGSGAGISCNGSSSSNSSTRRGDEYMVTNNVPWEYRPIHAVRSIVPPVFMTLVPIRIYAAMMQRYYYYDYCVATMNDDEDVDTSFFSSTAAAKGQCKMNGNNNYYYGHNNNERLSGKEILLIPRLFMTILSIIFLDGSLWLLVSYRNQQQQQCHMATTMTKTTRMKTQQQQQQQQQTIAILLPSPPIEVILLASSWPCLVLSTRPFTNSLETMCLAVLLVIIVRTLHHNTATTTTTTTTTTTNDNTSYYCSILPLILIGITCSIGIFIRFTFAFFALPSVIIFLYHRWKKNRMLIGNNKSSNNRLLVGGRGYRLLQSLLLLLKHVLHDGIWIIVSFALVSYIFIYIDTKYYTSSSSSSQVNSFLNWNGEDANDDNTSRGIFSCPSSSLQSQQQQEGIYPNSMLNYITPMNALLYNSKQDNLALHGLHSRITHIGEFGMFHFFPFICIKVLIGIFCINRFMYIFYIL